MQVKVNFPRKGSSATPPHPSGDFKWKDYCPKVFKRLRDVFNINPAQYMLSICGTAPPACLHDTTHVGIGMLAAGCSCFLSLVGWAGFVYPWNSTLTHASSAALSLCPDAVHGRGAAGLIHSEASADPSVEPSLTSKHAQIVHIASHARQASQHNSCTSLMLLTASSAQH